MTNSTSKERRPGVAHFTATRTLGCSAAEAWQVVADYERDPDWRQGVETMAPAPAGPVAVGTTTAEVLHVAGRTLHNDGVVTGVGPGLSFEWRTTSGAEANGARRVEPLDAGRCAVTLELEVRFRGLDRLAAPLLRAVLRRGLVRDLDRLAALPALRAGAGSPRRVGVS